MTDGLAWMIGLEVLTSIPSVLTVSPVSPPRPGVPVSDRDPHRPVFVAAQTCMQNCPTGSCVRIISIERLVQTVPAQHPGLGAMRRAQSAKDGIKPKSSRTCGSPMRRTGTIRPSALTIVCLNRAPRTFPVTVR